MLPRLAASAVVVAAIGLAATTITAVGLATDATAAAGSEATTTVPVLIATTVIALGQEGLAT
jgi:Flp pilus assembly protein CpaB